MMKTIKDRPYYGTEVLPEAHIELYRKGYAKHISIMAGSTADEARLFMGESPSSNTEIGATYSVELIFVFDDRDAGTSSLFNGTNISDEIFTAVQQTWTSFPRCGNPSTDRIGWKSYPVDDQNVMVIAGQPFYRLPDFFQKINSERSKNEQQLIIRIIWCCTRLFKGGMLV